MELSTNETCSFNAAQVSDARPWQLICAPRSQQPSVTTAVIVHGLAEHPGRHFTTARHLARRGVTTHFVELPGHGSGGGASVNASVIDVYRAYATHDNAADTLDALTPIACCTAHRRSLRRDLRRATIDQAVRHVRRALLKAQQTADQVVLIGFSLGGAVSLRAVQQLTAENQPGPAQLILINPVLAPAAQPDSPADRWLRRDGTRSPIARAAERFAEAVAATVAPLITVNCRWVIPWISEREAERSLQRADPLIHRTLPASYLLRINRLIRAIHADGTPPGCPARLLIAARDRVVNARGAVRWVERTQHSAASPVDLLTLPDSAAHELHRSNDAALILNLIADWTTSSLQDASG